MLVVLSSFSQAIMNPATVNAMHCDNLGGYGKDIVVDWNHNQCNRN